MSDQPSSFAARLKAKASLLLGGILLILLAFYTLSWNEQRVASSDAASKNAPAPVVLKPVGIPASPLNPANEGKVVVISGQVTTNDVVVDPGFDLNQVGLILKRDVDMYQWQQIEKKNADNTTTVEYKKVWADKPIDASKFSGFSGGASVYENPKSIVIPKYESVAKSAKLGDFFLSQELIKSMPKLVVVDMSAADLAKIKKRFNSPVELNKAGPDLYLGSDPNNPGIGDIRIHFTIAKPQNVTVLAQQQGNKLVPVKTHNGKPVFYVKSGTVPVEQMQTKPESQSTAVPIATAGTSWTYRIIGLLLMSSGFLLLFSALSHFADKYAILANLKGQGVMLHSAIASIALSVLVIAYSGFAQHPFSSILLILLLLGGTYHLITKKRQ